MEIGVGPVAASPPEGGETARSPERAAAEARALFRNGISEVPPKRYHSDPMERDGVFLGGERPSPKAD